MTNTFFTYYFFYYIFTNNIYKTLPEMAVVTTLFKSVTKRQIIVMKQLSPLKIVFSQFVTKTTFLLQYSVVS